MRDLPAFAAAGEPEILTEGEPSRDDVPFAVGPALAPDSDLAVFGPRKVARARSSVDGRPRAEAREAPQDLLVALPVEAVSRVLRSIEHAGSGGRAPLVELVTSDRLGRDGPDVLVVFDDRSRATGVGVELPAVAAPRRVWVCVDDQEIGGGLDALIASLPADADRDEQWRTHPRTTPVGQAVAVVDLPQPEKQ